MRARTTRGTDRVSWWLLVVALAGLGTLIFLRLSPSRGPDVSDESDTSVAADPAKEAATGEATPDASEAFHRLEGRWLRPDGGYVLNLKWVGADGQVEAAYLNPQPIFVSRAEASEDGDRIKVMVELQDRGYPGCVYTLHYDAARDVLVGDYYQAAMRATFAVEFERLE